MAPTRILDGTLREVWQETVPLDGGSSTNIITGIRVNAGELSRIAGYLHVDGVIGSPTLSATTSVASGLLVVTITNGAVAGNTATYTLDVTHVHSIQQSRDPSFASAPIGVVSAASAPVAYGPVTAATTFGIASNSGAALTAARADHTHGTPSDAALEHIAMKGAVSGYAGLDASAYVPDAQISPTIQRYNAEHVVVAKSGGQYTSVAAACNAVAGLATAANPYLVEVAPGVYDEPPFTIPAYVMVNGSGWLETILRTTDNADNFITGTPSGEIRLLGIDGPTGLAKAGIYNAANNPIPFFIENVLFRKGYYGIRCAPPASRGSVFVRNCSNYYTGSAMQEFIRIEGFGNGIISSCGWSSSVASAVAKGYVLSGANAIGTMNNCSYEAVDGSALYVNNGALIRLLGCNFMKGTTAIHVGPDGTSYVAAHGCLIQNTTGGSFTTDLYSESALCHFHYSGSASRNKINIPLGADLTANITDVTTGSEGSAVFGELRLGETAIAEMTPIRAYSLDAWYSGYISGGAVTRVGAGSRVLNVAAGRGYINDGSAVIPITWTPGTATIAANSEEYIYVDDTSTIRHQAVQPDYSTNIILAQAKTNATDVLILTKDEIYISHLCSRLQEYLEDVIGPISLSGAGTSIHSAPSLELTVDGGTFAVGLSERTAVLHDPITWTYWYHAGVGTWTAVTGQNLVNTATYDNGAALVPMTGGKYKKDMLYVSVGGDGTEYHVVAGQEEFATQIAAEQGANPTPPDMLSHYAMRSGGIVVLAGAASIASIADSRPHIGQTVALSGAITDHGALTGLADDDHAAIYLNTARALIWHGTLPGAHVTNGDTHDHTGGAGNQIDHTTLANRGVNTHPTIDAHLIDTTNPHLVTAAQAGAPPNARNLTAGAGLTGGGDLSADRTFNVVANADGSIIVNADDIQVGILANDTQHGVRGGGTQHAAVIAGGASGFMTGVDKTKLDGISASAAALTAVAPVNVTKAAADVGAAAVAARGDHKHDITTAAAGAIAIGDIAAEGGATSLARSDHVHGVAAPAAPADVTKAAANTGASGTFARADHKHDITTAIVGSIAIGDAAAEGNATTLARSNHVHGVAAPGAPADVTKAAANAGASGTFARADHKHDITTAIVGTVAIGDVAAEGNATTLARSNHVHAVTAPGAPANVTKAAANAGASANFAREDHKHDITTAIVGTVAIGDAAAEGNATTLARSNHVHAVTAPGAPADVTKAAANAGASANFAREDHKHDITTAAPVTAGGTTNSEGAATTLARSNHVHAIIFGASYQVTSDTARTTLTGANSNVYPPVGGGTKLTLVTPALAAGQYRLSWAAVTDYDQTGRNINIRVQNTTDATTIWEHIWRPTHTTERHAVCGFADVTFAGVAKTFAMQFRNTNTGDTSGVASAWMSIFRVS